MNKFFWLLPLLAGLYSCNGSEKKSSKFFPALSFIKSQVAHVDTSLYRIIKIEKKDSLPDTTFIRREEFRHYANDFLTIPDITVKKTKKKYTETELYDETINKIVFTYVPKNADAEIRRQEVIVQPDQQNGDKVESIYIDRWITSKDSSVQKKMMWQVDKRFKIVTIIQKNNQPEKIRILEVVWNDFDTSRNLRD
ncbi:MAG: hypothetical protein ICV66_01720 [Chitinophagaceae bacterium]|nr:hypothetical protein [Chitinophagaceae bacterium]